MKISVPSEDEFRECLIEMDSFRSFEHRKMANEMDLDEKSIRFFVNDLAETLNKKEVGIIQKTPFKWINSDPSYRHAFKSIFGGESTEKWGSKFVDRYVHVIVDELKKSEINDFELEQKSILWRQFLANLATANANSWMRELINNIFLFLFNPDDIGWEKIGFGLEINDELNARQKILSDYLDRYSFVSDTTLIELMKLEAESLKKQIRIREFYKYSPILKNDKTSLERYYIFNIWLWFIDRSLNPPNASIFSNLLNIIHSSKGERGIQRHLKRWREEYRPFGILAFEESEEISTHEIYFREADREREHVQELILMQVNRIPWQRSATVKA